MLIKLQKHLAMVNVVFFLNGLAPIFYFFYHLFFFTQKKSIHQEELITT